MAFTFQQLLKRILISKHSPFPSGDPSVSSNDLQIGNEIDFYCRRDVWIAILGTTLIVAIFKTMLLSIFSKFKGSIFISFIWTSLTPIVGGKPGPSQLDSRRTYKAIIFISLLGGLIIWIAYRSFLTAALSVVDKKYPFNDLESLSKTNWK